MINPDSQRVCEVTCCGETLIATPERALYWPAQNALLVADWHLGKAEVFGSRGLAIPAGSDESDFGRLAALVETWAASKVMVLGDLMHAPPRQRDVWPQALADWLRQFPQVEVSVIAGNHDRVTIDALPESLSTRLMWHAEPVKRGPFVLDHEPEERADGYVLAGHLHPVFRLQVGRDRARAPVFWFRERYAVLPAFGSFTGGMNIKLTRGERIYMTGPDSVIEVVG
ncbi:MAG: ligase-associated DNA damage response endonuclease PdeM [Pseudomonadota bacterium]